MLTNLDNLLQQMDLNAPNVAAAATKSNERIEIGREFLKQKVRTHTNVDLIAFGSLARREATDESDFDYLVLVDGIPRNPRLPSELLQLADSLRREWATADGHDGDEVRQPGATGLFGSVVGAFDLIEQIGLERDTNHSLTRRMLLLEESVSLLDEHIRERVVRAALDRYLIMPGVDPGKVPRYLLNDVVRYWRTISVDYQAKANGRGRAGLRYLKLLIPRKVQYASMLMSLLLCGKLPGREATTDSLLSQLDQPPLARLLVGYDEAPQAVQDAMRQTVRVTDEYLAKSAVSAWREDVSRGGDGPGGGSVEFETMRTEAKGLQDALETIFFDWELIATDARSKLVF